MRSVMPAKVESGSFHPIRWAALINTRRASGPSASATCCKKPESMPQSCIYSQALTKFMMQELVDRRNNPVFFSLRIRPKLMLSTSDSRTAVSFSVGFFVHLLSRLSFIFRSTCVVRCLSYMTGVDVGFGFLSCCCRYDCSDRAARHNVARAPRSLRPDFTSDRVSNPVHYTRGT